VHRVLLSSIYTESYEYTLSPKHQCSPLLGKMLEGLGRNKICVMCGLHLHLHTFVQALYWKGAGWPALEPSDVWIGCVATCVCMYAYGSAAPAPGDVWIGCVATSVYVCLWVSSTSTRWCVDRLCLSMCHFWACFSLCPLPVEPKFDTQQHVTSSTRQLVCKFALRARSCVTKHACCLLR